MSIIKGLGCAKDSVRNLPESDQIRTALTATWVEFRQEHFHLFIIQETVYPYKTTYLLKSTVGGLAL